MLVLMHAELRQAMNAYAEGKEETALDYICRATAIGFRCMENFNYSSIR